MNITSLTSGSNPSMDVNEVRLFLCGDVMTGRGVDQIMAHPGRTVLYESWVTDARDYVALAQRKNGRIQKPVADNYIWGDSLEVLEQFAPDARIINLETSITTSIDYWRDKGINYRMHPDNIGCLQSAKIDACVLANNHLLDWGYPGLDETLESLTNAGIRYTGAGVNLAQAWQPVALPVSPSARLLLYSVGCQSSGIPPEWAATDDYAGVCLVSERLTEWVERLARYVAAIRQPSDLVVVSIHWGGNWGYGIPSYRRKLAHRLIDDAGVDIVHGHSSHHALGIERYRNRLILYGCGDLINDYEGIGNHREYRGDLPLLYLVRVDAGSGALIGLEMFPMQLRKMRLHRACAEDVDWIQNSLDRESRKLGCRIALTDEGSLALAWAD